MITFRDTMDPHSLDVYRGDIYIGMLQWHPERSPRFCCRPINPHSYTDISLDEMTTLSQVLREKVHTKT